MGNGLLVGTRKGIFVLKADADRVPSRYRTLIEAYLRALNTTPAAAAPARR